MRTKFLLFALGSLLFLGFQSCNPNCESLASTNINVPPGPYQEGTELAITAVPSSLLEGRSIHISFRSSGSTTISEVPARFEKDFGAAIVEIPVGVSNDATFLIEDPDCTGNLIPIGSASSIVDETFFINNPFFITPIPPLIVLPSPPLAPPPAVVNAWFSPQNRDYCIWFVPTMDTLTDGTIIEYPALKPGSLNGAPPPVGGSVELSANCDGDANNRLYHKNPVSGIVDREANLIRISIDRTSKGLGIEDFEGQFINPNNLPDEEYFIGGACEANGSVKPNIMYLRSLQTGRQLILWRGVD